MGTTSLSSCESADATQLDRSLGRRSPAFTMQARFRLQDEVDHIKGKSVLTKLSIQKRAPFLITKKAQMEKLWTVLISPMIGNTKLGKEMSA